MLNLFYLVIGLFGIVYYTYFGVKDWCIGKHERALSLIPMLFLSLFLTYINLFTIVRYGL